MLSERSRREERKSIRPLVSGPATDNLNVPEIHRWILMNFQLGVFFLPILRVRYEGIVITDTDEI